MSQNDSRRASCEFLQALSKKSLQISQIASYSVRTHFCNCNKNIFPRCVARLPNGRLFLSLRYQSPKERSRTSISLSPQVVKHPSKVIEIRMKKSGFRMEAGQVSSVERPRPRCKVDSATRDMRKHPVRSVSGHIGTQC